MYEVGLYKPDGERGHEPAMIPRTWDEDTLTRSTAWLKLQNMSGRNVYVRPKGEHNLSLVDDLSAESVARMKREGFQPAVLVETSPDNFQAWLKHPRGLPRELSTATARELAERFGGDRGAADWRHFGRLSGFTNRKQKYRGEGGLFPFVRLTEAEGLGYREGERFVTEVARRVEELKRQRYAAAGSIEDRWNGPAKGIEAFRENPAYGGDGNRIDLAYAIYALGHGQSEADVKRAITTRDLGHKGNEKRQAEYLERTVGKAASIVRERGYGR
jgi:hypothetical protein